MPYVASDGSVVNKPPISRQITLFFLGLWNFIVFFFKTLFGENVNKSGSKYTREYRGGGNGGGPSGGGGPGRGQRPPERRMGRPFRMSDLPCPPSGG